MEVIEIMNKLTLDIDNLWFDIVNDDLHCENCFEELCSMSRDFCEILRSEGVCFVRQ